MTGLSNPLTPSSPMPLDSLSPSRLEYLEASEEVVLELCVDEVVVVVVSSLSSEDMTTAANGVDDVELFAVLLLVFVDPFGSISGHLARVFVCFSIELTVEREREILISCSTGIPTRVQFILYESGKSAPLTRSLLISSSIC